MAGNDDIWESDVGVPKAETFSLSRFLEYTDPSIERRFRPVTDFSLDFLRQIPAVFMSEIQPNLDTGGEYFRIRIGRILSVSVQGSEILYTFTIDRKLGKIPVVDRNVITTAFGMERLEIHRTHWAIKDAILDAALNAAGLAPEVPLPPQPIPIPPPPPPPTRENPIIETVEGFLNHVMQLPHSTGMEIFYRGHADRRYRLEPSLFRKNEKGGYRYLPKEETMVRELLTAHASEFSSDRYMLDQLVRMQHYGLPTRLLDVTSNPLIALYFACSDEISDRPGDSVDGEVILMSTPTSDVLFFDSDKVSCLANLCLLTEEEKNRMDTKSSKEQFNTTQDCGKLVHFISREKPYFVPRIEPSDLERIVFVRGRNTHERIQAQSGAFLLFGNGAILEETGHSTLNVERVTIRNKRSVLAQLNKLNIKTSTIYPGIEKATAEIARKHELRP